MPGQIIRSWIFGRKIYPGLGLLAQHGNAWHEGCVSAINRGEKLAGYGWMLRVPQRTRLVAAGLRCRMVALCSSTVELLVVASSAAA